MQSVSQIEEQMTNVMEKRACILARESGCIQRERKFTGADLLQTLVFGWLAHPESSLEQFASTAATRDVLVSDTAIHQRKTRVLCSLSSRSLARIDRDRGVSRSRRASTLVASL
jgi:hypothetical protein